MINIICKECKYKNPLRDILWINRGKFSNDDKIICAKCGRVLIEYK